MVVVELPQTTPEDDLSGDRTVRGRWTSQSQRKKPCAEEVRRGCTVPSTPTWPLNKKSDGTETFATTSSVDGYSVLPETKFVGDPPAHGHHTRFLCKRFPPPYGNYRREARFGHQNAYRGFTPDFSSSLSSEVFSTRGYFHKTEWI